jgi:hypothetical protein
MKEFFDYLAENGITPNGFYVLWGIANKVRPAVINVHTELRLLADLNLIEDAKKGILTDEGNRIIDDATALFGNMRASVKKIVVTEDDMVVQYLEMFPKGKLPSGKAARLPKNDLKKGFEWFFKNYDYSWDTILKATAYYVDSYEKNRYMYMKNSQYFIRKQNIDKSWDSELAAFCEIILNGGYTDDDNHIKERVV